MPERTEMVTTSIRIPAETWARLRIVSHNMKPPVAVSRVAALILEEVVSGKLDVPWLPVDEIDTEVVQASIEMRRPRSTERRRTESVPAPASPPAAEPYEVSLEELQAEWDEDDDPETDVPDLPTEVRGLTGRWNEGLPKGFVVSFRDLAVNDPRIEENRALLASVKVPMDAKVAMKMLAECKIDSRQFRDLVGGQERVRELIQSFEDEDPLRKKLMAMAYADMRRERAVLIDMARREEPKLTSQEEMYPPREKFQAMLDRGVDRGKLKEFLQMSFDCRECPRCGQADLNGEPTFFGLVNPDGRVKCPQCRAFVRAGEELLIRS